MVRVRWGTIARRVIIGGLLAIRGGVLKYK